MNATRQRASAGLAAGLLIVAGQCPAQSAPDQGAIAVLARQLDAAFDARDPDAYLDPFEPRHVAMHARLVNRIRTVLSMDARLERRSTVERYWRLGEHGIAVIASETRAPDHPGVEAVRENALWAVRGPTDALRIVLAVEVDAEELDRLPQSGEPLDPKNRIRCQACNYSIQSNDDWLMVPNCRVRLGCLESFSFYSLTLDLAADLSIHMARDDSARAPDATLRRLVTEVEGADGDAVTIRPWLPPMYSQGQRPMYLAGARCVLDDRPVRGARAEIHLATYGRLGYLITVRGNGEHIDANRPAVRALLGTFALNDPDLHPAQIVKSIAEQRQGGTLEGNVYRNKTGVRFAGPAGWAARLDASFCAFDVTWTHPDREATIRLKGLIPTQGTTRWTETAADSMLRTACDRAGLRTTTSTDWGACSDGFGRSRWLEAQARDETAPRYALLRVGIDPDLLVIVELQADDPAVLRELRGALEQLTRQ